MPSGASTLEPILSAILLSVLVVTPAILLSVLVVTPLVTTAYLARRMKRRSRSDAGWTTPSTVA